MNEREKLSAAAAKLGIGGYSRHVLLCLGPECCDPAVGEAAWEALKAELKANGLSPGPAGSACYRTKVGCLRVCQGGPVAVVYPEGTWYRGLTADRIPRFVAEHLRDGRPIDELVFARNPLPMPPAG